MEAADDSCGQMSKNKSSFPSVCQGSLKSLGLMSLCHGHLHPSQQSGCPTHLHPDTSQLGNPTTASLPPQFVTFRAAGLVSCCPIEAGITDHSFNCTWYNDTWQGEERSQNNLFEPKSATKLQVTFVQAAKINQVLWYLQSILFLHHFHFMIWVDF